MSKNWQTDFKQITHQAGCLYHWAMNTDVAASTLCEIADDQQKLDCRQVYVFHWLLRIYERIKKKCLSI